MRTTSTMQIIAAAVFAAALLPACGSAGPDPCVGEGCTLPDAGDESDALSDTRTDAGDTLGQDSLSDTLDTVPTDPCADFLPIYEESIAGIYWSCDGLPCEFPNIRPGRGGADPNRCVMVCVSSTPAFFCYTDTIRTTVTPGQGVTSFTCTTTSGTPRVCRR